MEIRYLRQEAYWEWREFSRAVQEAYDKWSSVAGEAADQAFADYMHLLDLEERVAVEYASLIRRMPG